MVYLCAGCDTPLCELCFIAHQCPSPVTFDAGEQLPDHDDAGERTD
jgi:hypothetical protein